MGQANDDTLFANLNELKPIQNLSTPQDLLRLKEQLTSRSSAQPLDSMVAAPSRKFAISSLGMLPLRSQVPETGQPANLVSAAQNLAASSELQVFRRETPALTTQQPASVPLWAAGQKAEFTLGPFQDTSGRLYWFDFYRIVRQVVVIREPAAASLLTIPLRGILTPRDEYELSPGSVWIDARLLTPSAPPGSFTGLKIKGGSIKFDNIVSLVAGNISIKAGEHFVLDLLLDQPAADNATDTKTGADARNTVPVLPKQATIDFTPLKAEVGKVADATLQVYGNSLALTKQANATPYFEPAVNRLVIPFTGNVANFKTADVKSDFFILKGDAPIEASGWALSVTQTTWDKLGEAAGIGAIVVKTLPGLEGSWPSLDQGNVALKKTIFLVEPGRIGITAPEAKSQHAKQTLYCWQESNPDIRSIASVTFSKKGFGLAYNCLSSGSETLSALASASCSFDRPLTAAKSRLPVETDHASLLLYALKDRTFASLYALNMLGQATLQSSLAFVRPVSIALTNALLLVSPVDAFLLFGILEDKKRNINDGFVLIRQALYRLIPTLPDPYVANFQILPLRERFTALARTSSSGYFLVSTVRWKTPVTPQLSFYFATGGGNNNSATLDALNTVPSLLPASGALPSSQPSAMAGNTTFSTSFAVNRKVFEEDRQNEAALDRYLGLLGEGTTLLDVSSNADIFGVNLAFSQRRTGLAAGPAVTESRNEFPLSVEGVDLVTAAANVRIYTLPQIQWEPVATIQNPDVQPYPFPSPAASANTGDPTLIATESYKLVPIAPIPVIGNLVATYNDPLDPKRAAARFNLPFGMKAAALLSDPQDITKKGSAAVALNQPAFTRQKMTGGIQIKVTANYVPALPDLEETPALKGATIQTRNLVDPSSNVPLGLSVLGPDVDDIFNQELKPGGFSPRVPVQRIDFSGYGATIFSNWLDPKAKIALVSQVKLDVLIGRTAHEVVQVKSILYPWAVPVVRTITIQRMPGGGVTRYDSGWQAQGPGYYDFSYDEDTNTKNPDGTPKLIHHPSPLEFHPGVVRGIANVSHIRDTGRRYAKVIGGEQIILSEVIFNGDLDIENVRAGKFNNYVPSKGQRGFMQIAPPGKPLNAAEFQALLKDEGPLGGPADCVIEIDNSGQLMRITGVDVNNSDESEPPIFVSAARGSIVLPKEGSWSVVKRKENTQDIIPIDQESGLPLIRQNGSSSYRFSDPVDILHAVNPRTDYGIMQSTKTQKVLFLRPFIKTGSANIESDLQPHFADSYAILNSLSIFPSLNDVFKLGPGGTVLNVLGAGQLRLPSPFGQLKVPPNTQRDLLNLGSSRIYVDYSNGSDTSDINMAIDTLAPKTWEAALKQHSIVIDIESFKKIVTVTGDFASDSVTPPGFNSPQVTFGSILQPIMDILKFLGNFDLAKAMAISMSNAKSESWQPKWQAELSAVELKFPLLEIRVAGFKVKGPSEAAAEAFEAATPLPPIRVEAGFSVGAYYKMAPFSYSTDDSEADVEAEKKKMLSAGASLKLEGAIHILAYAISPKVGLYFVGSAELELGIDSQEGKSLGFKVGVGLELYTKIPVLGEVSVYMGIGMEFEFKDKGSGIFFLLVFKGEAELLGGVVVIGINLEAKGGTEKEIEDGIEKTFGVCEVEFAVEISLFFIINIEFDVTWQEKKQVS